MHRRKQIIISVMYKKVFTLGQQLNMQSFNGIQCSIVVVCLSYSNGVARHEHSCYTSHNIITQLMNLFSPTCELRD